MPPDCKAPDPRVNAFRPDLADIRLRNAVAADRYSRGRPLRVAAPVLSLRARPDAAAPQVSELLAGDAVRVFETRRGWCWLQNLRDGYTGYARATGLGADLPAPCHQVCVARTPLLADPDPKSPLLGILSLTAAVCVTARGLGPRGLFHAVAGGGHVYAPHLRPLDAPPAAAPDLVAAASLFLGTPYVWGGNSGAGMDCSGLVQIALRHCGVAAPRDADMQEAALGEPVAGGPAAPRRGDLIFWRGHVALHAGEDRLLHANAGDMAVALTPLAETVARILAVEGTPVSSVRRL